jgi:hypothetical protein
MTQYGTWVSYGGTGKIGLAAVLLAVAGSLAFAGTRLRHPVRAARPGRTVVIFMLLTWVLAIGTFLICLLVYVHQERQDHVAVAPPADPIAPVTLVAAIVIFLAIFISARGSRVGLASAAIAAMAAPMLFEFPFDLIVMARIYPPVSPDPGLYRALFFAPLFLIELTTLSFLTLSPMVRLSRATFFFLAMMVTTFAVWALFGFGYPSAPVPIALNIVSKILAFVAAASLFLPREVLPAGQGRQAYEERAYYPRDVFAVAQPGREQARVGQERAQVAQAGQEPARYPQNLLATGGRVRDRAREHAADR